MCSSMSSCCLLVRPFFAKGNLLLKVAWCGIFGRRPYASRYSIEVGHSDACDGTPSMRGNSCLEGRDWSDWDEGVSFLSDCSGLSSLSLLALPRQRPRSPCFLVCPGEVCPSVLPFLEPQ